MLNKNEEQVSWNSATVLPFAIFFKYVKGIAPFIRVIYTNTWIEYDEGNKL